MGIQTLAEAIEYHERRARNHARNDIGKQIASTEAVIMNRLAGTKKVHPATLKRMQERAREGY